MPAPYSLRFRLPLCVAIVAAVAWSGRHLQLDDALIYDRTVRNAIEGLGLSFNPGEAVNAMTSPLYGYLLLGLAWLLHGQVQTAAWLLFTLPLAGACAVAEVLFPWAGLLLAGMTYMYSFVGMETGLLCFLLLLSLWVYIRERFSWLPLILALLVLTRFEMGALAAVMAWRLYRRGKLPPPATCLPAVILLCGYLLINHHWFGNWIPTSSTAKIGQGRSGYWGRWPRAFLHVEPVTNRFRQTWFAGVFLLLAAPFGWQKLRGSEAGAVLLPFAASLFLFYFLLNLPNYHWYYAPFVVVLSCYAAAAVPTQWPATVTMLALVLFQAGVTRIVVTRQAAEVDAYVHIGGWLAQHTPPNATVEAAEIGELGWVSQRRILDIVGLTLPKNADHIAHRDPTSWLAEDKPDYVIVHPVPFLFERVAAESPLYQQVVFTQFGVQVRKRLVVEAAQKIPSAPLTTQPRPQTQPTLPLH